MSDDYDTSLSMEETTEILKTVFEAEEAAERPVEEPQAEPVHEPTPEPPQAIPAELDAAYQEFLSEAKALEKDYHSVDWKTLRDSNPDEYLRQKYRFEDRTRELAQQRTQIEQAGEQHALSYLRQEYRKVLDAIPEWRNEAIAANEQAEIRDYLRRKGYTEAEITGLSARDVIVAREAMLKGKTKDMDHGSKQVRRVKGKARQLDGITGWRQRQLESEAKRNPSGQDAIVLRLLRGGHV